MLGRQDPEFVYWFEAKKRSVVLGASPVVVSKLLSEHLFSLFDSVVMTSATLSTNQKDLSYFRSVVGAPEDAGEVRLDSPFGFEKQAALYLPVNCPEADSDGFEARFLEEAERLVELVSGGALFLFTSHRMLAKVKGAFRKDTGRLLLAQGDAPRHLLLERFASEGSALLFATASFWEGVDVPGQALELVVIDRLPFDSPDDPLLKKRSEQFKEQGKSPFVEYQLPRAIIRLKQGFGRLVRSPQDRGIVAILDGRIRTRRYGKLILRALPDARRIAHFEELQAWYREQRPERIDLSGQSTVAS